MVLFIAILLILDLICKSFSDNILYDSAIFITCVNRLHQAKHSWCSLSPSWSYEAFIGESSTHFNLRFLGNIQFIGICLYNRGWLLFRIILINKTFCSLKYIVDLYFFLDFIKYIHMIIFCINEHMILMNSRSYRTGWTTDTLVIINKISKS